MHISDLTRAQRDGLLDALRDHTERLGVPVFIKYLDLGTKVVRLVNYADSFTPYIEDQLAYALRDEACRHDATLVVWQEKDMLDLQLALCKAHNPRLYFQKRAARARQTQTGEKLDPVLSFFDEDVLHHHPLVEINRDAGLANAWDYRTNTYYYSLSNLDPEEIIKKGHLFVRSLSRILKGPKSNLVHGAVVGVNNTGVLFCGIGYRGKSTFSVNAMLHGFDYVSDDYISLGKQNGELRAWPIYSIITLSPAVWQFMRKRLRVEFLSNNGRKDKYVFSIAGYHGQFVSGYPVRLCMYPNFVQDAEPSIEKADRAKALEEFVFSSLRPVGDAEDVEAIAKLYSFVCDLPFYRINLTSNLDKNTRCLRDFLEHFNRKNETEKNNALLQTE